MFYINIYIYIWYVSAIALLMEIKAIPIVPEPGTKRPSGFWRPWSQEIMVVEVEDRPPSGAQHQVLATRSREDKSQKFTKSVQVTLDSYLLVDTFVMSVPR